MLKDWASRIRRDVHALWLAARDPRTPWYAKAFALAIAAYALSPIDLVPDFIPVLGYLDEVVLLLPLAILLAIRLVPAQVMAEHRAAAEQAAARPSSRAGAAFVIAIWIAVAALFLWWLWPRSAG